MTMAWVRKNYGVPAKVGGRVIYTGDGREHRGTITRANGGRVWIRLDGIRYSRPFHPTWKLEYLTETPKPAAQGEGFPVGQGQPQDGSNSANDIKLSLSPLSGGGREP